jgi:hypothetical protein
MEGNVDLCSLWEVRLENLEGVLRVGELNLGWFCQYVDQQCCEDSFRVSPSYYLLTGRCGLWIISNGGCTIPICWHPNKPGTILVFPALENNCVSGVCGLLLMLPRPPNMLQLGRATNTFADELVLEFRNKPPFFIEALTAGLEETLDWGFPVHIVSTEKAVSRIGKSMRTIRNQMNRAERWGPVVRPLDKTLIDDAIVLTGHWAQKKTGEDAERRQLIAPHERLFAMIGSAHLRLNASAYFIRNEFAGYAIWEMPFSMGGTANLLASICTDQYAGLSTFIVCQVCKELMDCGVPLLNIGGSENQSLDYFKRHFRPQKSVELCTLVVRYNNDVGS